MVYYDTYKISLGGTLMHSKYVVTYALRQLKIHVRNYPSCDLEWEVVVFMLKI